MKITKTENLITFEFPFTAQRHNFYDENIEYGEYNTFTGLIIHHRKGGSDWDEIGFANTIDRNYKGKLDDVGEIIVAWPGEEKEFIEKCKELGLNIRVINV